MSNFIFSALKCYTLTELEYYEVNFDIKTLYSGIFEFNAISSKETIRHKRLVMLNGDKFVKFPRILLAIFGDTISLMHPNGIGTIDCKDRYDDFKIGIKNKNINKHLEIKALNMLLSTDY